MSRAAAGTIVFPPSLLGFVQDATMAWLLSYDSKNTRAAYRLEIERWFAFCNETGLDPLKARKSHGDVYKRWLELQPGKPIPPKTMQRRISAVSSWYEYLADEEIIDANRFKRTRRPKASRGHSETTALMRDEARALVAAADADHGPARLRTSAFIRVLLHTGIRIEEAISADLNALGYERGLRTLRIVGKGTKPKKRRLPVESGYVLDRYLEDRARREGVAARRADLRDRHRGPLLSVVGVGSGDAHRSPGWNPRKGHRACAAAHVGVAGCGVGRGSVRDQGST
ncbi:hypothetical protein FAF44_00695 [Nonomuraea sp. MG754425]|nr:tyrosine-type recombinase/integrase [Nonomuraea sp. MG754425]MCF6466933.1 hypothetical protein [Nonomuraea sp. MG754425]